MAWQPSRCSPCPQPLWHRWRPTPSRDTGREAINGVITKYVMPIVIIADGPPIRHAPTIASATRTATTAGGRPRESGLQHSIAAIAEYATPTVTIADGSGISPRA